MSIKVCLLRTGETIIGNLKEVIDNAENRSIGYRVEHPYVIDYKFEQKLTLNEGNQVDGGTETPATFAFRSWGPLAAGREFNFEYNFIDVIYEPHAAVLESYNTIVNHYIDEHTTTAIAGGGKTVTTKGVDVSVLQGDTKDAQPNPQQLYNSATATAE